MGLIRVYIGWSSDPLLDLGMNIWRGTGGWVSVCNDAYDKYVTDGTLMGHVFSLVFPIHAKPFAIYRNKINFKFLSIE